MRLHLRYITVVQNVCALLTEDQANNITALALALWKFSQAGYNASDEAKAIECFHSRGQDLCKFIGTKESVCIRKELACVAGGIV